LRIVDSCRIGLVRVMCSSLVCSIGGRLWLFTAVFVQFLRWLTFLGATNLDVSYHKCLLLRLTIPSFSTTIPFDVSSAAKTYQFESHPGYKLRSLRFCVVF